MNDFKNEYQSAVQDMKEFSIDVSDCMDESRHKQRVIKRTRRITAVVFSATCIIFVCGFGTVRAADYIQNVIGVTRWGFESADAVTMARNETEGSRSFVMEEQIETASVEDTESIEAAGIVEESATPASPDGNNAVLQELATGYSLQPEEQRIQSVSGNNGEVMLADAAKNKSVSGNDSPEATEIPVYNYSSWEDFEKNEDITFPQPSISKGANINAIDITVCGDWIIARYDVGGKVLWVERTDYADTQGHTFSKVFPGGVCNERSYVTPQGYAYTLVDSIKDDDEELQIHAAATVGSYEAYTDFLGFTENEAKDILDSIDLSLYE